MPMRNHKNIHKECGASNNSNVAYFRKHIMVLLRKQSTFAKKSYSRYNMKVYFLTEKHLNEV